MAGRDLLAGYPRNVSAIERAEISLSTLRPKQNVHHFADDIFKFIFFQFNKFIPEGQIDNIPTLVQIMTWRRPSDQCLIYWRIHTSLGHNELGSRGINTEARVQKLRESSRKVLYNHTTWTISIFVEKWRFNRSGVPIVIFGGTEICQSIRFNVECNSTFTMMTENMIKLNTCEYT